MTLFLCLYSFYWTWSSPRFELTLSRSPNCMSLTMSKLRNPYTIQNNHDGSLMGIARRQTFDDVYTSSIKHESENLCVDSTREKSSWSNINQHSIMCSSVIFPSFFGDFFCVADGANDLPKMKNLFIMAKFSTCCVTRMLLLKVFPVNLIYSVLWLTQSGRDWKF